MKTVDIFHLTRVPTRPDLEGKRFVDELIGVKIEDGWILAQYECETGYLIIHDGNPYENGAYVILLDKQYRLLDETSVSYPFSSSEITNVAINAEDKVSFDCFDYTWQIVVYSKGRWAFGSFFNLPLYLPQFRKRWLCKRRVGKVI